MTYGGKTEYEFASATAFATDAAPACICVLPSTCDWLETRQLRFQTIHEQEGGFHIYKLYCDLKNLMSTEDDTCAEAKRPAHSPNAPYQLLSQPLGPAAVFRLGFETSACGITTLSSPSPLLPMAIGQDYNQLHPNTCTRMGGLSAVPN